MIYEYLIQDEDGIIVQTTTDRYHAKQLADVLSMRTGRPHFVDCMLQSTNGWCDYMPLTKAIDVPDRRDPA